MDSKELSPTRESSRGRQDRISASPCPSGSPEATTDVVDEVNRTRKRRRLSTSPDGIRSPSVSHSPSGSSTRHRSAIAGRDRRRPKHHVQEIHGWETTASPGPRRSNINSPSGDGGGGGGGGGLRSPPPRRGRNSYHLRDREPMSPPLTRRRSPSDDMPNRFSRANDAHMSRRETMEYLREVARHSCGAERRRRRSDSRSPSPVRRASPRKKYSHNLSRGIDSPSRSPAMRDVHDSHKARRYPDHRSSRRDLSSSPPRRQEPRRVRRPLSPPPHRYARPHDRLHHEQDRSPSPRNNRDRSKSDLKRSDDESTANDRTVYFWQLAERADERDVFYFFSRAGKVRDVRLITDRRSKRHKGQGFVEFYRSSAVRESLIFNGEPLCGYPIAVKAVGKGSGTSLPRTERSAIAVPIEIPQPPPPPIPLGLDEDDLMSADKGHSNEESAVDFDSRQKLIGSGLHNLETASKRHVDLSARLVSIEELAVLINPHGLPTVPVTPPSTAPVPVRNVVAPLNLKDIPVLNVQLPETQQVPLPLPATIGIAKTPPNSATPIAGQFKRLYVGSVPFTVSEDDLKTIFQPFGEIMSLQLQREPVTGRSRGYGFVEFVHHEAAKKALELNGLVLAGRALKVNLASATNMGLGLSNSVPPSSGSGLGGPVITTPGIPPESDVSGELDDGTDKGLAMNASQRALLMQRLSRGEIMGNNMTAASGQTVSGNSQEQENNRLSFSPPCQTSVEPSRCLLLSNMFDPVTELRTNPNFDLEVSEDVRDEVSAKYGSVKHLFVDKNSRGLVYLMLETLSASLKARTGLNGRWFAGNRISAEFVQECEYKKRLPDAPL